jgi:hypothetical protein
MDKEAVQSLLQHIPEDILELLGRPSVLSTEDGTLYYATIAFFAKSIRPDDLILVFDPGSRGPPGRDCSI